MSQSPSGSQPSSLWPERYEQLRRYFLEGAGTLTNGTLALHHFLTQGMAGWMNAWSQIGTPLPTAPPSPGPAMLLLPGWQAEITSLLAQMSLTHLQSLRL